MTSLTAISMGVMACWVGALFAIAGVIIIHFDEFKEDMPSAFRTALAVGLLGIVGGLFTTAYVLRHLEIYLRSLGWD